MSDDMYPLTVTASPCEHSMKVTSRKEQEAFEASHREDCGADEFSETVDHNPMYGR
jgi:hypothetical protein